MFLEKLRENSTEVWAAVDLNDRRFPIFFQGMLELINPFDNDVAEIGSVRHNLSRREYSYVLHFLTHCFNSYEEKTIRECVQSLVSPASWVHLSEPRLNKTLRDFAAPGESVPKWWKRVRRDASLGLDTSRLRNKKLAADIEKQRKKDEKKNRELTRLQEHNRDFMHVLLSDFFFSLQEQLNAPIQSGIPSYFMQGLERFLELIADLLSQLPLRKCFRPLFEDSFFYPRVKEFIKEMRGKWRKQHVSLELLRQ